MEVVKKNIVPVALLICGIIFASLFWYTSENKEMSVNSSATTTMQAYSTPDPNNKPGVIDIGWQWMVAERISEGLVVRGTWDKNEQGVFVRLPDVDKFVRIKDAEGAPTPYFTTGKDIYIFKADKNSKKASTDTPIPTPFLIKEADVKTFIPGISNDLSFVSKDKNHVYIRGDIVNSLDPQTLTVVEGDKYLFKDKNGVYDVRTEYGSLDLYLKKQYDPATFTMFDVYGYTKDKNGVYFEDKKIEGADPKTFEVVVNPALSSGKGMYSVYAYSKDNSRVYYLGQLVPNANPRTFIPIDTGGEYAHYFGKDSVSVYEGTTTIPFADPKTFKSLWYPIYEGCGPSRYSKDATHVFFEGKIVTGADPVTFESLIMQYGRDKNGLWFKDKLETGMPKDFEPVCNYG